MVRIFLCHASEDKAQVREVYHQLKALKFTPWLDEVDILPGQDWDYEIERALETADFVIVFLSTRSVEKVGYVQREFRRALYRAEEMPEGFIHTISVKLDDCSVPSEFSRLQWVNLYENGAFDRIVRALHYGLQQRGLPLPEPAATTDTTLEPSLAAEHLPHLSEATRDLLLEAVQDNQGLIMRMSTHGGRDVKTHGRSFVESGNVRSAARWRGAVDELHNLGLVEDRAGKGEFFYVTDSGYGASERL